MTLYELMGWISTVALLVPIALLLIFKLALYRSFPALLGFLFILLSCNILMLGVAPRLDAFQESMHNMLEAPLILAFLTYFSRSLEFRKRMMIALATLVAFELVVLSIEGFSSEAYKIMTAPGLALCLGFGLYFFIHQVKLTIVYQKAFGKAMLASSMFFATIGLSFIYVVRYFTNPQFRQDADLVQFMIVLFTAIGLSIGLIFERKRVKQLEELRIAREELKAIYGDKDEKATGPFGTVAFNLDNEGWN